MTEAQLTDFIKSIYSRENESCEWKEFTSLTHSLNSRAGDDIVSYLSGIANMEGGEMIIGIKDKTADIIGISDFHGYTKESIKSRILDQMIAMPSDGFQIEELTTSDTNKSIWIIHIPKHLPRQIVYAHRRAWKRDGDSLVDIDSAREQVILNEPLAVSYDWSRELITDSSIDDLDPESIIKARKMFAIKNDRLKEEMQNWDDITFLNYAKITIRGKLTNAAIILLGKPESESLLTSGQAKIYWVLKNKDNKDLDYHTYTCPMIFAVDEVYSKIRNVRYRYQNESTIFPEEMDRYDPGLIREALHNCIAHQDYQMGGRITVVENDDGFLVFSNLGSFLPGNIESILLANTPPELYRNPFLANAMVTLNMIDTRGSGIIRMFNAQKARLFPMPDYNIVENKVVVTITGKVIDNSFAELLLKNVDLSINEIYLLDKVQKKKPLLSEEAQLLKRKNLIEGRKPNYYLSKPLSAITDQKIEYSKIKGLNKKQYFDMIMQTIDDHTQLNRKEINKLLWDILPSHLNADQKNGLIHRYLSELRMKGSIENIGTKKYPIWKRQ